MCCSKNTILIVMLIPFVSVIIYLKTLFILFFVQFLKYYETDSDIIPPVKLDSCLTAAGDLVHLTEPLVCINITIEYVI